jgi:subfamily B ATP-binding cassette protein MsbA
MTICKAILTYSDSVVAAFVNSRITHSIRSQIFSRVMVLSQTELDQMESGRLLNLLEWTRGAPVMPWGCSSVFQ